jgi:hypothetical protein
MTYLSYGKTTFSEESGDAFGRLRVSSHQSLFDAKFTYGVEEKLYNTTTASGGATTFLGNESAWNLTTTTAAGSRVLRQTKGYMQYSPGKSQLVMMTGLFGTAITNCTKRIGYYDNNDGLFFIQDGTNGFGVCERTSTSGSPVDTIIYQSSWNVDKLDGTGPSGITLDVTKTQILIIDFQWLGVGTVRYGFDIGGQVMYVHKSHHANTIFTQVYIKSAWLPLRYEIVNTNTTSATGALKQICSSVSSEGGSEHVGNLYTASNLTVVSVTTAAWVPIASITINSTLNSYPYRGQIQLSSFETLATGSNSASIAIFENATLTGASWSTVNAASAVSSDTASTAISGGTIRYTGFNGGKSNSQILPSFFVYGYAGDTFTVAARGVGGNTSVSASINWREIL